MSTARWNLKEAAGKILARRTEITYEAVLSGQEGKHLQSPIVIREGGTVDVAGIWEEGHVHYRGDLSVCLVLETLRDVPMDRQKSADAIVAGLTTTAKG